MVCLQGFYIYYIYMLNREFGKKEEIVHYKDRARARKRMRMNVDVDADLNEARSNSIHY